MTPISNIIGDEIIHTGDSISRFGNNIQKPELPKNIVVIRNERKERVDDLKLKSNNSELVIGRMEDSNIYSKQFIRESIDIMLSKLDDGQVLALNNVGLDLGPAGAKYQRRDEWDTEQHA